MRNTTKLKAILLLYVIAFDIDDENNLNLTLTDKRNGRIISFVNPSYTAIVGKAYGHMLKETDTKNSGVPAKNYGRRQFP